MKRAILVSSGTLAGLVAVLTYSGGDTNPIVAAAGSGQGAGLGGPPPAESTDPGTAPPADSGTTGATGATGDAGATGATGEASPTAAASTPAAAASPTAAAAKPTAAATKAATKATPAPTTAAPPPAPTKAAPKPTPKPTVAVAVAKDFVGSLETHKYGKVQVGIRVKAGKIIAVWPVVYPNGDSQPYSDFSIPVFKSETMNAQGANIANVSGATLTWQSWKKSLQSAMAKAGI
jgi:uncharacterized protein with FMN-binding domain